MALKEQLRLDVADAMRAGDNEKRDTLRLLLAAIKQDEVDSQTVLRNGKQLMWANEGNMVL